MKIYKFQWEERKKPKCTCCTDEGHPWETKYEIFLSPKELRSRMDGFAYRMDEISYLEYRNDNIYEIEAEDWQEIGKWQLPKQ